MCTAAPNGPCHTADTPSSVVVEQLRHHPIQSIEQVIMLIGWCWTAVSSKGTTDLTAMAVAMSILLCVELFWLSFSLNYRMLPPLLRVLPIEVLPATHISLCRTYVVWVGWDN